VKKQKYAVAQKKSPLSLAVAATLALYSSVNVAQELEEVIVTGVAREGVSKLEASVSVSSLNSYDIEKLSPRSVAELFRALPGIRSESSGGNGNANITVRGIPLATGGSKYMQLHEDGLPVLEFGDMNFANTDNFIRSDWSVGRVESIRGGSASTVASNSPGGIINMISKKGGDDAGAVGITIGADYDEFRTDFEYGGSLASDITYHVAGFFRDGEGVRETGFNGDNGGQIKFNITKELEGGYLRFYGKQLDDKTTTYLPSPVLVKSNGSFGAVPGYDASSQTLHSAQTNNIVTYDPYGNPKGRSVSDGIESKVSAFGFEFDREIGNGWSVNNKFRNSSVEGGFISPFTDGFAGGTSTIAAKGASLCADASVGGVSIDCSGGVAAYVNGQMADPNQLAFTNLLFDTTFDDVGLMVNDLTFSKDFDRVSVTAGYYYSKQNIDITWNSWHTRMQTLQGNGSENITFVALGAGIDAGGNAVDVMLADNGALTQSFLSWDWDLEYVTSAPYLNVAFQVNDRLNIEAGVRRDETEASGRRLDGCCGGNQSSDLNGNGSIGSYEVVGGVITRLDSDALLENAGAVSAGFITGGVRNLNDNAAAVTRVNYKADNTSYTFGATYALNDDSSVFVRYSDGGRAIADRLTQVAGSLQANGALTSTTDGYDNVEQLEVGYKHQAEDWSFYATLFDTMVEETNAEITSGLTFVREYDATGLELEGDYDFGNGFRINGNVTWIDAEIASDATNAAVVGNTPRRQADMIYTISPEYSFGPGLIGASIVGSSDFYLQDSNQLKQDAYQLVHLYANYQLTDSVVVSLNVNNLTDEFVITESEEGAAAAGSFVRARPLSGRSTSISVRYDF